MESSIPDKTPELREAYQRLLEERGSSPGSQCPDPDDLLALAEKKGPEEDRLRTMDHVAQCRRCRKEFDLLRAVVEAGPGSRFRVRPWMAAAASVTLLLGTGYGIWRGMDRFGDPVLRGPESDIELLAPDPGPAGGDEVEFAWQPAPEAFEYVLEILDSEGRSLFSQTLSEPSYVLDLAVHPNVRGNLLWWVRARFGDGTEQNSETRRLDLPDS